MFLFIFIGHFLQLVLEACCYFIKPPDPHKALILLLCGLQCLATGCVGFQEITHQILTVFAEFLFHVYI